MLDYAEKKYGRGFVADVKALKNCTYIFLPLPLFWALFDQQVRNLFLILNFTIISQDLYKINIVKTLEIYHINIFRGHVGHFKQPE